MKLKESCKDHDFMKIQWETTKSSKLLNINIKKNHSGYFMGNVLNRKRCGHRKVSSYFSIPDKT